MNILSHHETLWWAIAVWEEQYMALYFYCGEANHTICYSTSRPKSREAQSKAVGVMDMSPHGEPHFTHLCMVCYHCSGTPLRECFLSLSPDRLWNSGELY